MKTGDNMDNDRFICSWSTSPIRGGISIKGLTLDNYLNHSTARTLLRLSLGGNAIRLKISNKFGLKPLTIDKTTVANRKGKRKYDIDLSTLRTVLFDGKEKVTIPPGEYVYSDEVEFDAVEDRVIAVSFYVKKGTELRTKAMYGSHTYLSPFDRTDKKNMLPGWPLRLVTKTWVFYTSPFLIGVDVKRKDGYCIVVAGDSTVTNLVPHLLKQRLRKSGIDNVAVVQKAICGNRLMADGAGTLGNLYGEGLLKRFDEDVLSCSGIKSVIVKIGFNDVCHPKTRSMAGKAPYFSPEEIIEGYRSLVAQAHSAGLKIAFYEKHPWKGFERKLFFPWQKPDIQWNEQLQQQMDQLNMWMETNDEADAYIPLVVLKDNVDPMMMAARFSPDRGHMTEEGQRLMAESIPECVL